MHPEEKIYGVHWEVDQHCARWQLTSANYLRVDVTGRFGAKYRVIAYRDLSDEQGEALKVMMRRGDIAAQSCGQDGFKGFDDDLFEHVDPPENGGNQWRVTNCAHIMPGLRHEWSATKMNSKRFRDSLTHHPQDGYVVQFNAVPWDVMVRYWRKPINLNRYFHGRRSKWSKTSMVYSAPAIEVLDFDLTLLKQHKCFFADFSHMWSSRTRVHGVDMGLWMLQNVHGFSFLTDAETPFNRHDEELMFTLEWM